MNRRKDQIIYFSMGVLAAVILFTIGYACYAIFFKADSPVNVNIEQQKEPKEWVAVVAQEIKKGETITNEKVHLKERNESEIPSSAVKALGGAIGKKATVTLDQNTVVTGSMVVDVKDWYMPDERIKDYDLPGGLVGDQVKENDLIDIEILRPDGSSDVVLAKKKVRRKQDNKIYIQTTAQERMYMNYAIAEARHLSGKIESSLYMDEGQKAPDITYKIPSNPDAKAKLDKIVKEMEAQRSQANNSASQVVQPAPNNHNMQTVPANNGQQQINNMSEGGVR